MKKRIIIAFLCVLLLIPCAVLPTSAETLAPGDEMTFTVSVPQYENINSGSVWLYYDATAFELAYVYDDYFEEDVLAVSWLGKAEQATIQDFNPEWNSGVFAFTQAQAMSGEIFCFTLKVKDGAKAGEYPISAKVSLANNAAGTQQVLMVDLGKVVIAGGDEPNTPDGTEYATGDINGDQMITAADINLLTQVFKNKVADASAIKGNPDVNGDGLVTAADINALIALFKYGRLP